jgi:NADP-dependent 3-hydroxy acid dehydrogenase YdfG
VKTAVREGSRQEVKPYNIRTTVVSPGALAQNVRVVYEAFVDVNEILFRPTRQGL